MCHNLYAVDVVSHLHFTTNKEPRRLFSAVSVSLFSGLFCYSPKVYPKSLFYLLHQQTTDEVSGTILALLPTGGEAMLLP